MIIATQKKDVRHPEGMILLKSGKTLECFPKADRPAVISRDEVTLDTTGEFLQVEGGPKKVPRASTREPWVELFFREAFFLYEHRERVLSDSRMFLTPLPFRNNLAYSGTSGLNDATLGVYLEWWDECERAVIRRDGAREQVCFPSPFSEIWSSFMRINRRYTEAKQTYQSYTLEETLSKLREA